MPRRAPPFTVIALRRTSTMSPPRVHQEQHRNHHTSLSHLPLAARAGEPKPSCHPTLAKHCPSISPRHHAVHAGPAPLPGFTNCGLGPLFFLLENNPAVKTISTTQLRPFRSQDIKPQSKLLSTEALLSFDKFHFCP
jgi:hypothetical protein